MKSVTSLPAEETRHGSDADEDLLARLRRRDEEAFVGLVRRYHDSMVRVARSYVPSHAVAEEVVQETWTAVLSGLARFEARSSLRTWIFRILVNRAKTRGVQERRTVPFSTFEEHGEPSVEPDRFLPEDHPRHPGHWVTAPSPFGAPPEDSVVAAEVLAQVRELIDGLVPRQRAVITLRDVEGWSAAEVCETLGLTDANQRVLLHRARSSVRAGLERYLHGGGETTSVG